MFNFWSITVSLVLGLIGISQLHEYMVSGNIPANFNRAPRALREIVQSHDAANARQLVLTASYVDAAGERMVVPGNLKLTIERLTGRVDFERSDKAQANIQMLSLTDVEILRAMRFLTFKGDTLVLRDEPDMTTTSYGRLATTGPASEQSPTISSPSQKTSRVTRSRALTLRTSI